MNIDVFTNWMEEHFVPIAAKIGSQKHLVSIRDAFIGIMPITMAGSIATLLNVFLRDLPTQFGWTGFVEMMQPFIGINGNVWWGSMAILSLVFAFSLGYQISKSYNVNPLSGGLIAFASFVAVTPQSAIITPEGAAEAISGWGYIGSNYTDAKGLFTAMIIGFLSTIIYAKMMNKNIIIKLPDSVPPAVSKAFAAIIPGVVAIYVCAIISYLLVTFTGLGVGDLILKYIQMPFLGLSQGFFAVLIATTCVSIFWFFGLHGTNVLAPVLDGIYLPALMQNNAYYVENLTTKGMPFLWTRGSFDAFAWMGGAGCTIGLVIAILIFSKVEETKTIAKLGGPMACFNINEPMVFGLPIVLNPLYIIPWVLVPSILVSIAYFVTAIGLVPPVFVVVPWVMPPIICAWMATGGSIAAALLALFNLVLGTIMWALFIVVANRFEVKEKVNS